MDDSTTTMNEEEITLDRYLIAVWRAKWFILLLVLASAGAAALLALRQPTLHTAAALIKVGRVWKEPLEDPYVTTEVANSQGFNRELAEKIRRTAAPEYGLARSPERCSNLGPFAGLQQDGSDHEQTGEDVDDDHERIHWLGFL